MAELLVITDDKQSDRGVTWKRGEVVTVQADGHPWGRAESLETWVAEGRDARSFPGNFTVVKLPGVPVGRLEGLIETHKELVEVETPQGTELRERMVNRRLWAVDDSELTGAERGSFDGRVVTLSETRVGTVVKSRRDGGTYGDRTRVSRG